ncbi:MAG TPA: pyridoxamine 5'-phosphate oxidase family protein [Nitrososphaeraceae archaeon]|nr:pyridoxamine 5'-phosphate oxidase family protein [Nitrososphaeraceae archaeon]
MKKNGSTNSINKTNEVRYTKSEEKFLLENEACRIATSHNDIPHIAPVAYIYKDGFFFIATDYNTRKYKNIKANKNIALSVDIYDSSVENKAIIIQGNVEIIERGQEFKDLYQIFNTKFEWVRRDPWKEGEAPFFKIKPFRKVTWGI